MSLADDSTYELWGIVVPNLTSQYPGHLVHDQCSTRQSEKSKGFSRILQRRKITYERNGPPTSKFACQ